MPNLWKANRTKSGRKSIRGTISAPIPIVNTLDDDDEFPIRNPGSAKAMTSPDDEFPMRRPGTGIASPVPPPEPETVDMPAAVTEQQDEAQTAPILPSSDSSQEPRSEEQESPPFPPMLTPVPVPATISAPIPAPGAEARTDAAQDIQPEAPVQVQPGAPPGSGGSNERPASRLSPQKTSPQRSPPRNSPIRSRTSPPIGRTTNPPISMARYSMVSESPSGQTGYSKDSPQRKKSSLRSALGRIFGRGRKRNGNGSQDTTSRTESARESRFMGSSQHRSVSSVHLQSQNCGSPTDSNDAQDPTALGQSKERSASLPLTEYNRPLRSHSIGPEDIMAIESARNSLQAETSGPGVSIGAGGRRRAATAGSRPLFQPPMRNPEWGAGLSPRPASSHGRGSRLAATNDFEDPNEIGRAITSDSGNGGRRRSRSLSGLQDLVVAHPESRRRSDEIRFWRESYNPGFMSPLSSNVQEDIDMDDMAMTNASAPESPAVERPRTPPQPFNFDIPNTMIGMKITQAASIETRLGGLESRTSNVERVVDQLCHAVPGFKAPLRESAPGPAETSSLPGERIVSAYTTAPPAFIPSISRTMSSGLRETTRYASSHRSLETADTHSQMSFGDAPTFIGSLHPPSSSATQSQPLTATAPPLISPLHRPTSNSTVRGTASLPTMGRDSSSNEDAVASLVAQLEAERAARQALEAQVKKLSERLNVLSTTMFAMIRGPSESRSQERLTPGGNSPALHPPKVHPVPPSTQVLRSLSGLESDDEDEESNFRAVTTKAEVEEDALTEDFQTPAEDRPPLSYGAFGEELRPDDDGDASDPKRKKAARTLSLSQLTLKGQSQRTQI